MNASTKSHGKNKKCKDWAELSGNAVGHSKEKAHQSSEHGNGFDMEVDDDKQTKAKKLKTSTGQAMLLHWTGWLLFHLSLGRQTLTHKIETYICSEDFESQSPVDISMQDSMEIEAYTPMPRQKMKYVMQFESEEEISQIESKENDFETLKALWKEVSTIRHPDDSSDWRILLLTKCWLKILGAPMLMDKTMKVMTSWASTCHKCKVRTG